MRATSKQTQGFNVRETDGYWIISFTAMSSPCEILIRCNNSSEADKLASLAFLEAIRIEKKFSRYRDDNIVFAINNSCGESVQIDAETFQLLTYSAQCHELSEGLFDITSGILRRAWKFDGREARPDDRLIGTLLKKVGWDKVKLTESTIKLRAGMEIDFGGVGKEYAVDKVAQMLFADGGFSLMVNFGGDIRAINAGNDKKPWVVGIENPSSDDTPIGEIDLAQGAVATSGDSRRFCTVNGRRLGHILNPRTGWPVENSPRSVTVLADYCTEAGFLSTLAMLQGQDAEEFLTAQGIKFHCAR